LPFSFCRVMNVVLLIVQNPVVTQNKYSLLQEEGVYDNG